MNIVHLDHKFHERSSIGVLQAVRVSIVDLVDNKDNITSFAPECVYNMLYLGYTYQNQWLVLLI